MLNTMFSTASPDLVMLPHTVAQVTVVNLPILLLYGKRRSASTVPGSEHGQRHAQQRPAGGHFVGLAVLILFLTA